MAVTSPHLCGMGGDPLAVVSAPGSDPVAMLARWAGPDRASTAAVAGPRATRSCPYGVTSTAFPSRGRWMGGSLCTTASAGSPSTPSSVPPSNWPSRVSWPPSCSPLASSSRRRVARHPGPVPRRSAGPRGSGPAPRRGPRLRAIVAGGARASTQGEFGNALVDLGERRLHAVGPRAWHQPNGALPAAQGVGARPLDGPPAVTGLPHPGQLVDRRAGRHRGGPVGSPVAPSGGRGHSGGRTRPPGVCSTTAPTAPRSSPRSGSTTPGAASLPDVAAPRM